MPGALPDGSPAPADGLLPKQAASSSRGRDFGVYVHVPFCRVRCGYCDFNTYTSTDMPGVSQGEYPSLAVAEIDFAKAVLAESEVSVDGVSTVFFGGGTPTLLEPGRIGDMLAAIERAWGIAPGAEVTVEANPDTVDATSLEHLRALGVTRVSFGVQSFVPHVLETLDRTHNPEAVPEVVQAAKAAGLQVSLDVIYGTPGESADDWKTTLDRVMSLAPDHVSAYSLIVEPGTALARRVDRGELPAIDDDVHAEYYEIADTMLEAAGYRWYEVSNWARGESYWSQHNLGYWRGHNWWGIGPGAHSHVGGVRWWNVKHPKVYAERIRAGVSPAHAREHLGDEERHTESVMLALRTTEGLDLALLRPDQMDTVSWAIAEGFVDGDQVARGRLRLTRAGRLLADGLALRLLG